MGAYESSYSDYERAFAAALQGQPDPPVGTVVNVPGHIDYVVVAVKPAPPGPTLLVCKSDVPRFIYHRAGVDIYLAPAQAAVSAPAVAPRTPVPPVLTLPPESAADAIVAPDLTSETATHVPAPPALSRADNVAMPTEPALSATAEEPIAMPLASAFQ